MAVSPKTVRDWIKADKVRWRPRGNQGRDVFVPPELDRGSPGEPPGELEHLREAVEHWRTAAEEAREEAAVLRGELVGIREVLARSDAERDRLAAELAEARKGWLERVLEAVRRKS
jgi:hypothetical protein